MYANKVALLADIGRLDEAEVCCRKAMILDAECSHAYETMGLVMRRSQRPAKVVSYYNEAVRLYEPVEGPDRDLARLYGNMGTATVDMDGLEDSIIAMINQSRWTPAMPRPITTRAPLCAR